jgi:hypothetical protein
MTERRFLPPWPVEDIGSWQQPATTLATLFDT